MLDNPPTTPEFTQNFPEDKAGETKISTWEAKPRLTVLRAPSGKKCVKIISLSETRTYDKAAMFSFEEVAIEGFCGFVALLKHLETHDDRLIVSGRVKELFRNQSKIPRRKKPRKNSQASIEDAGSRVAMFDCDNIKVPEGFGWHDPAALAEAILGILKERIPALKDVRVFWQASARAGRPEVADMAKFHFWVLLDAPLLEKQKRALYAKAKTDKQLSCPIQPHYIGRPLFRGVPDPLASLPRSGVIEGSFEQVCVANLGIEDAELSTAPSKNQKRTRRAITSSATSRGPGTSTWAEDQLDNACDLILSADDRNVEINRQAFFIGGAVAKGLIEEEVARDRLHEASAATGHERFEDALNNGFQKGFLAPLKWDSKPNKPNDIEPYCAAASEDRASAIKGSREMIRGWAKEAIAFSRSQDTDLPSRAMQHGMQGGGKTSALVGRVSQKEDEPQSNQLSTSPGALHDAVGLVSAMYMPTHTKCEEAAKVYEACAPKGAPPCIVIRGRGQPDPEGDSNQKMCLVSELADHLAKQGATVRSTLCIKCPYKDRCGYIQQENLVEQHVQSGTGLVVFAPHTYAFLPLPAETLSDIAIFDESPGSNILDQVSIPVSDLLADLQFGGTFRKISDERAIDAGASAMKVARKRVAPTLKKIADAYCPEHGLDLNALRQADVDAVRIDSVLEALNFYRDKRVPRILGNALKTGSKDAPIANLAEKARKLVKRFNANTGPRMDHLKIFLEILKAELELGYRWPIAIFSQDSAARRLTAVRLRPLTHAANKPFLYIDGTGDPYLAKIMFGADLKPHLFAAERNAKVTQIIGHQFSAKSVLGNDADKEIVESEGSDRSEHLQKRIKTVLDRFPDAAVFTTKKIREALGLANTERAGHFSAVRGLNQWQDRETAIIIGRQQPSMAEIEVTARAYAARIGEPLEFSDPVWEWRGIRVRDTDECCPVVVMTHPNALVDKLLRQTREAEIEQAIDRLRLVHNQDPKEVFILNEIAISITVDHIVQWRDFWRGGTRPERAAQAHGFLPLNGQESARLFPEIWNNRETANQDLKIFKELKPDSKDLDSNTFKSLMSDPAYRNLYTNSDAKVVCLIKYKRTVPRPQRASWRAGLVFCPPDQAQEKVEGIVGALKGFEIQFEYSG